MSQPHENMTSLTASPSDGNEIPNASNPFPSTEIGHIVPETLEEHPLLNSVTCPVCLEIFNDPRLLDCHHSFCFNCIADIHTSAVSALETAVITLSDPSTEQVTIVCPTCRVSTTLETGNSIQALPRNYALSDIVNIISSSTGLMKLLDPDADYELRDLTGDSNLSITSRLTELSNANASQPIISLCAECRKTQSSLYCVDCQSYMCTTCAQTSHDFPIFKTHQFVTISAAKTKLERSTLTDVMACPDHPPEMFRYYCITCEQFICRDCIILDGHQRHVYISVQQATSNSGEQIRAFSLLARANIPKLHDNKKAAVDIREHLNQTMVDATFALDTFFTKAQEQVQNRRVAVLQNIDDEFLNQHYRLVYFFSLLVQYLHSLSIWPRFIDSSKINLDEDDSDILVKEDDSTSKESKNKKSPLPDEGSEAENALTLSSQDKMLITLAILPLFAQLHSIVRVLVPEEKKTPEIAEIKPSDASFLDASAHGLPPGSAATATAEKEPTMISVPKRRKKKGLLAFLGVGGSPRPKKLTPGQIGTIGAPVGALGVGVATDYTQGISSNSFNNSGESSVSENPKKSVKPRVFISLDDLMTLHDLPDVSADDLSKSLPVPKPKVASSAIQTLFEEKTIKTDETKSPTSDSIKPSDSSTTDASIIVKKPKPRFVKLFNRAFKDDASDDSSDSSSSVIDLSQDTLPSIIQLLRTNPRASCKLEVTLPDEEDFLTRLVSFGYVSTLSISTGGLNWVHIKNAKENTPKATSIPTGFPTVHDGGCCFDSQRRCVWANYGRDGLNGNRIHKINIDTNRMITIDLPFPTHGASPLYDGSQYVYIFENSDSISNPRKFCRINVRTRKVESLPNSPEKFLRFACGCYQDGNLYYVGGNRPHKLMIYSVASGKWKMGKNLLQNNNQTFVSHPTNKNVIYAFSRNRQLMKYAIDTQTWTDITRIQNWNCTINSVPAIVPIPRSGPEANDPYFIMGHGGVVYNADAKSWEAFARWGNMPTATDGGHFFYDPFSHRLYFHAGAVWNTISLAGTETT